MQSPTLLSFTASTPLSHSFSAPPLRCPRRHLLNYDVKSSTFNRRDTPGCRLEPPKQSETQNQHQNRLHPENQHKSYVLSSISAVLVAALGFCQLNVRSAPERQDKLNRHPQAVLLASNSTRQKYAVKDIVAVNLTSTSASTTDSTFSHAADFDNNISIAPLRIQQQQHHQQQTLHAEESPQQVASAPLRERVSQSSPYQTNASVMSDFSKTISQHRPPPPTSAASSSGSLLIRRPGAVGLFGGIALTSTTSYILRRRRSLQTSTMMSDPSSEQLVNDACTVVCLHIPFCVSERQSLLNNLDDLVNTVGICANAATLAHACRKAAIIVENEAVQGVLEDSTKFGPHVDVFIAQSFKEAERRFCAHVNIEGDRVEKLINENNKNMKSSSTTTTTTSTTSTTSSVSNSNSVATSNSKGNSTGDYGVVVMVIATVEGVNLKCYDEDDNVSNLQKLRCALESLRRVKEGEITGLELLWAPERPRIGGLTRTQMMDSYPGLRIQ